MGGHIVKLIGSSGLANPSIVADPTWYPDSGATAHMTNDSTKLFDARLYNGGAIWSQTRLSTTSCL